jgi:hypothetical protein
MPIKLGVMRLPGKEGCLIQANSSADGLLQQTPTPGSTSIRGKTRSGSSGHMITKTGQLKWKNIAWSDESQFLLHHADVSQDLA